MSFVGSKKLFDRRSFAAHRLVACLTPGSSASFMRRTFAATTTRTTTENPYRILNVPVNSNYETVKAAFLKAALRHHPDHSKQADTTAFVRVRQAFEEIVYNSQTDDDATTTNKTVWKSDVEFQEWFRAATGEFLSFDMNHQTRQEVIRVYRTMSSGGKDKGGYWEMARQLAEREDAVIVKRDETGQQLSGGDGGGGEPSSPSSLRRQRKR